MDYNSKPSPPISISEWLVNYLLLAIPLVGIIMLFMWAFGDERNETKKNWAKAHLILVGIVVLLYAFILIGIAGATSSFH